MYDRHITAALWASVLSSTLLSVVYIWFLLDPPANPGATTALAIGATMMWFTVLTVAATRRAYRRRN